MELLWHTYDNAILLRCRSLRNLRVLSAELGRLIECVAYKPSSKKKCIFIKQSWLYAFLYMTFRISVVYVHHQIQSILIPYRATIPQYLGLFYFRMYVPLGMANGTIPESAITASSYVKHALGDRIPQNARLGSVGMWANEWHDSQPWIQVDLGTDHIVTGLQTEGDSKDNNWQYWVEQIRIKVGYHDWDLKFIEDGNGFPQVRMCNILGVSLKQEIVFWIL